MMILLFNKLLNDCLDVSDFKMFYDTEYDINRTEFDRKLDDLVCKQHMESGIVIYLFNEFVGAVMP